MFFSFFNSLYKTESCNANHFYNILTWTLHFEKNSYSTYIQENVIFWVNWWKNESLWQCITFIERNIYSSLQGAAYAFPDKDGNSHKILGFRHLLRFLNNFYTTSEDHERHSPYGIKYLQRSIQKYPICQEEINQFIEYFIEKSSNDEVAKSAMITFKASISINNHFKSCLQLTG